MEFQTIIDACAVLPSEVIRLAMLGGGALRSAFDGTPVKDYDLFFETPADWQTAARLLSARADFELSANAQTLFPTYRHIPTGRLFNPIGFRFYSDPLSLAESFDFRCTALALRLSNPVDTFNWVSGALMDCYDKRLNFQNLQPTNRVAKRLRRYVDELGYQASDEFIERLVECSLVTNEGMAYNGE